ncbi:MAG: oxygenase MpaB family protein [Myxococcota bacterium]
MRRLANDCFGSTRLPKGDRIADAAVQALLREAPGADAPSRGDLLAAVEALGAAGDPACRAFVVTVSVHPRWVDADLLARGQRVALSLAIPTGIVLLLGGLTEVYGVTPIARVLGKTKRLESSTWRRMLETGRFIRDIHRPGGLAPGGEGARAIARIRLIHAMVRARLEGSRDVVTQQQMAFTLYAHSHVVRTGLSSLGFGLDEDEAQAHQHLWRVVGHMMGVDRRVLPSSPAAEAALYRRLYPAVVDGSCEESQRLVACSIETVRQRARLPRGLVHAIVHRLAGRPLAARLGVPSGGRWARVLAAGTRVARIINRVRKIGPVRRAFAAMGGLFADRVVAGDPDHAAPVGAAAARGCARALDFNSGATGPAT